MQVFDITCEQAQKAIQTAIAKAKELNTQVSITVVDYGGNLKAFTRMDGTLLGSIDISQKKAKTARYFEMPTGGFGQLTQPGGPFYAVELTNEGLVTFPGGMPLKDKNGKVIGAIGVSGSTVENDQMIAEAACSSLLS